jgi:hypothetical protein
MYTIGFKKWSNPRRESLDGYNAWDYLSGDPPVFETKAEAGRWMRSHQKGKDRYGVKALFKIVQARGNPSKRKTRKRVSTALKKWAAAGGLKSNPGRKLKGGGRAISLKNFTGRVIKKGNQVFIEGRGKRG